MLPRSVRVGHVDYSVTVCPDGVDEDGNMGEYDNKAATIKVAECPEPVKAAAFLHECIHAAVEHAGVVFVNDDHEESAVKGITFQLLAMMRDNPALFPMLDRMIRSKAPHGT